MRFSTVALLTSAITVVNAHFQLAYPAPRGPFNAKNEVNFCDNYVDPVDNRTEFPISGGYVTLRSGHPNWNLAISISNAQNPTSFDNFTNSTGGLVRNFATGSGTGNFCIPLDLSNTGFSSVSNGANVTIQIVYNAGDGSLYQCADLTLAQNFSVPSNVSCTNVTTPTNTTNGNTTNNNSTGSKSGASGITATGYAARARLPHSVAYGLSRLRIGTRLFYSTSGCIDNEKWEFRLLTTLPRSPKWALCC